MMCALSSSSATEPLLRPHSDHVWYIIAGMPSWNEPGHFARVRRALVSTIADADGQWSQLSERLPAAARRRQYAKKQQDAKVASVQRS